MIGCRLIGMINGAAGAITSPVVAVGTISIGSEKKALLCPFARKRKGEAGKAVRRCWNGLETFDLFDAPDSSGTNDQIEEAE